MNRLRLADGHRLVEVRLAALRLAGMRTDTAADGRANGLRLAGSEHQGVDRSGFSAIRRGEPGHVHVGRAGVRSKGRRTAPRRRPARQSLSRDVLLVLVPEVTDRGQHRVGAVCPRPTDAVSLMIVTQSSSSFDIALLALALADAIQNLQHPLGAAPGTATHLPQDSSCTNSMKKRATSTMQLSSSMTISPPEPMMAPSAESDS